MAKAFEEMGVCAELLRVIEEEEWLVPTPVQTEVIPLLLGGGDVLAAAETV
jgi:ATP-dependent RNA helicase DDX1